MRTILVVLLALSACSHGAGDIGEVGAYLAAPHESTCPAQSPRLIVVDVWPSDSETGGAFAALAKWDSHGGITSYQGSRWTTSSDGVSVRGFAASAYASLGVQSDVFGAEIDISDGLMTVRWNIDGGCVQHYSLSPID